MSDTSTQATEGETEGGDPNIKQLREKAKRADELEAGNLQLQRENALLKSGLDLESPVGQLFAKSYDGELTAEALKAEAEKYGVPMKGTPVAGEETGGGSGGEGDGGGETIDPTGTAERRALADGAPADSGEDKDPRQLAKEHFDQRMTEGAPEDVAAGEHINMLANAAMRGDTRVIYDEHAQRAEAARRFAEG